MHEMTHLMVLLVLGSARTQQVPIVLQENFELEKFMGRWYEVAVASTCPHYMQRKRENAVMVALKLEHVPFGSNFTMTTATSRNSSCVETSTNYFLTNTTGRFFHHVSRFRADIDSFVLHTDEDDGYTVMLQLSTEKPSGNKTSIIKLYSRTADVSPTVLHQFQALTRLYGMSDDAIIINQNKGVCFPGEQMTRLQVPVSL
ncbi:protein AMBP isoform X1 [Oryzias latipes]|uniref:protein AMBP isoform X1 n=1 Tax=Oryzias latipes TaxID=8090 RepID=UPI0000E9C07A|nr:protein AMBP isoform X1 [Oryzias latipes]XP_023816702.1 protein AMBP isoform X1 [Oryzias latipes]